jgi:zinc transporter, ZIP family
LLNVLVAALLGGHGHGHGHGHSPGDHKEVPGKSTTTTTSEKKHKHETDDDSCVEIIDGPSCCNPDPVGRLEKIQNMANKLENNDPDKDVDSINMDLDIDDDFVDNLPLADDASSELSNDGEEGNNKKADKKTTEENKRLVAMGTNTAIAIGLHNFPEGLATFVAALDDPRIGAVLATAIAIHNIPEGLCVALPIFYATGNRRKAFLWALLSGASEILAALLGWAVLANSFSDSVYGILFGIVAGMMIVITNRELLPTAHFYDPEDTIVTYAFIFGMVVTAASLVMFALL